MPKTFHNLQDQSLYFCDFNKVDNGLYFEITHFLNMF